jgi:multiple sugar transport system substrate-binding protein
MAKVGQFPALMTDDALAQIAAVPGFPQDANSKAALQVNKAYLEMPLHAKSAEIETVLNEEHDGIMTGNTSLDDAIAAMNSRIVEILGN